MGNNLSVAGHGLSRRTHPGANDGTVGGRCVVVGVLCNMRSIAPMYGPHDEKEQQAEDQCETFFVGHVINKSESYG